MEKAQCPDCGSSNLMLNGHRRGRQQYQCKECKRFFREPYTIDVERKNLQMDNKGKKSDTSAGKHVLGVHKDDLKKKYDVGRIVDETIARFEPDGFLMSQSQFIDHCGIAGMKYTDILSDLKYEAYRGKLGGTTYWGHPDDIKDMKINTPMR